MPRKSRTTLVPKSGIQMECSAGLDTLLPDEDPQQFEAMRDSLLAELSPTTAYQVSMAMNLVYVEWDIRRHRRLLAATIKTAFAQQASGVYDNSLPGKTTPPFRAEPERKEFLNQMKSIDKKDRAAADLILSERKVTRAEITAAAFLVRESAVAYHEARMSELERRRRSLLECYEALASRPKTKPILDAEIVEAA